MLRFKHRDFSLCCVEASFPPKPRQGREPGRGGRTGAGFAAQENAVGEGIGWFAAKRDDVADERALGIEVEMFLA